MLPLRKKGQITDLHQANTETLIVETKDVVGLFS